MRHNGTMVTKLIAEPVRHNVLLASLGGLIHDLGVPWSLDSGRAPESTQFECETRDLHRDFATCASCKRRYRNAHGPLGATLLNETLGKRFEELQKIAAAHHGREPEDAVVRWVARADYLAVSDDDRKYCEPVDKATISAMKNPLANTKFSARLKPGPLRVAIPSTVKNAAEAREASIGAMTELRAALTDASKYASSWESLPDHLLGAVYRGATFLPSGFHDDVVDTSLAVHCHITGALAGAIAHDGVAAIEDDTEIAAIIAGDISGIQDFIHEIASKGAARALRARSFYLQVLSEVAARHVARECGVTPIAVVLRNGGNFQLIVPRGSLERLNDIQRSLDKALFDTHGTRLSVTLAGVPVIPARLKRFSELRNDWSQQLSENKSRRFALSAAQLGVFEPRNVIPAGAACASCGRDAANAMDDQGERLCRFCEGLQRIGQDLRHMSYLLIEQSDLKPPTRTGDWQSVFNRLGFSVRLSAHVPAPPFDGAIFALDGESLEQRPCARFFPVGQSVPWDHQTDQALDFAGIVADSPGRQVLATAKLDVDDLGRTLGEHLDGRSSPSRFSSLSQHLSLFFEGYLNGLTADPAFNRIYMVYAGGDDLLCAGPFDQVRDFVARARDDFRVWTGENPAFNFSCGLAVDRPHRPIIAMLEAAKNALDAAKTHVRGDQRKNAIDVMGRTFGWDSFQSMVELSDRLIETIRPRDTASVDGAARSLLQHLKRLDECDRGDGKIVYGPLVWRTFYYLRRYVERQPQAEWVMNLHHRAFKQGEAVSIALAARIAELATAPMDRREELEQTQ